MHSLNTLDVQVLQWLSKKPRIKGVFYFIPDMMDNNLRYQTLFNYLNKKGYHVCSHNHIGHGSLAYTNQLLGKLPFYKWKNLMTHTYSALSYTHHYYPHLPIYLCGHGLGALLGYHHIIVSKSSFINRLILSGMDINKHYLPLHYYFSLYCFSKLDHSMSPSTYLYHKYLHRLNLSIHSPATLFDWLSTDSSVVSQYINDMTCGMVCSPGFYFTLSKLSQYVNHTHTIKQLPLLPIMLLSGDQDPKTNNGKDTHNYYSKLLEYKKNVHMHYIQNERHDIFLGKQKQNTFKTILDFLSSK